MIGLLLSGLAAELREMDVIGPRARRGHAVTLAVVVSVMLAAALALPDPWWAGISAFMCSQATRSNSLRRTALRILGTAVGAVLGLMLAGTLAYDHVLGLVSLLGIGTVGMLGFMLDRYGYAWLLGAITALMVILSAVQDPRIALTVATNRMLEVVVGSLVALAVALLLAPDGDAAPPPAPGFTDLFGANWPTFLHALRCGSTVMLIPLVWTGFDLPGLPQMAVTVAAVMAATPGADVTNPMAFVTRALHRLLGCLFGGIAGLAVLALSLTTLLPWLIALAAGVFVSTHVQTTSRGHGYVGTQAAIVFIMTMVQGDGPPISILPGIDRFVGITAGLAVLVVVSLLLWPGTEAKKVADARQV